MDRRARCEWRQRGRVRRCGQIRRDQVDRSVAHSPDTVTFNIISSVYVGPNGQITTGTARKVNSVAIDALNSSTVVSTKVFGSNGSPAPR